MRQVSISDIFRDNETKLGLVWLAGRQGADRTMTETADLTMTLGQVGHMNFIHPFCVQILGAAEVGYLESVPQGVARAAIDQLFSVDLVAIIVANAEKTPAYLAQRCEEHGVPLMTSYRPSPYVVDVLRLYLSRMLAQSTTLHGVFLDVLEMGVLITGASAIGKSELALELISRGHGLIADDVVELYRVSPDTLEGRCPAVLRDFLEVRGIGVLNIRTIFGETAVRPHKILRLIAHLEQFSDEQFSQIDRLEVKGSFQEVISVPIRKVTIPVAAGRNLSVLVEAAVRNYVLQTRGVDSTREFIERQQSMLGEQP